MIKLPPQNLPRSNNWFLTKAAIIHGDKFEYLSPYINKRSKINIKCNKCLNIFYQRADSHLEGRGCKNCAYKNNPVNQLKYSISEFEEKCNRFHKFKYEYFQDFSGVHNKIKILCKKHNNIFYQFGYAHLNKGQGCPKCNISKGEEKISECLKNNNIEFISQKTFDDCKNIYKLSFDFYLPQYNTCIEFDGQQHFISVDYFGGDVGLEKRIANDTIKNNYCKINNIILIRIKWNEIDNILSIINNIINNYDT